MRSLYDLQELVNVGQYHTGHGQYHAWPSALAYYCLDSYARNAIAHVDGTERMMDSLEDVMDMKI